MLHRLRTQTFRRVTLPSGVTLRCSKEGRRRSCPCAGDQVIPHSQSAQLMRLTGCNHQFGRFASDQSAVVTGCFRPIADVRLELQTAIAKTTLRLAPNQNQTLRCQKDLGQLFEPFFDDSGITVGSQIFYAWADRGRLRVRLPFP